VQEQFEITQSAFNTCFKHSTQIHSSAPAATAQSSYLPQCVLQLVHIAQIGMRQLASHAVCAAAISFLGGR